jgi:tRNA(Ile)-lysidine synthase
LQPGGDALGAVRAAADRLGVEVELVVAPVEPGPNLEERARRARRAALPGDALLGHTADDQAETVLLNLLRGSGLHGVAAMRRDGRRPLLDLRRSETASLCASLGLATVHDPMNDDRAIRRNRVRAELVPLMDDLAAREVVPLLCRFADLARAAADHLDGEAAAVEVHSAAALTTAPPVLAGLAVRSWLATVDPDRHPPDRATVERVLAVARGEATATDAGAGWRVRRSSGRLLLERD